MSTAYLKKIISGQDRLLNAINRQPTVGFLIEILQQFYKGLFLLGNLMLSIFLVKIDVTIASYQADRVRGFKPVTFD